MSGIPKITVIIPAFNEEHAIGKVIDAIPDFVDEVIVTNNNSKDRTSEVAKAHGATVVFQPEPGYGNACLKAMSMVAEKPTKPEIIVFLDGDYSDYPDELPILIKPIMEDGMDMVIGSRKLGNSESGSLTPQQIFGNWLATFLLRFIYTVRYTDLGPFRAIRYDSLLELNMEDRNYGWTVEMQVKAAKLSMKTCEVPVSYRNRIGTSKVSGTLKGSVLAGYKIIKIIFTYI
jgi:glycosyltransferase involved in cell wall biosynthesis